MNSKITWRILLNHIITKNKLRESKMIINKNSEFIYNY